MLVLIPSTTYRAGDFLAAARALDLQVVVGSDTPPVLAGGGVVEIPLGDPQAAAEAIVAFDAQHPLDAVVAVDDQGSVAAARAGERLGLRHNPPEAVAAARDKVRLRAALHAAEVPQPQFATVDAGAGEVDVARLAESVGLPCVVKPATLSGSQGVVRADTPAQAVAAVSRVRAIARRAGVEPDRPLLVESFVPGPEVAVEGMLTDGRLTVVAVFDKPDPLDGPYFEETLYVTPSRLGDEDLAAVRAATQAATLAVGLREGPVHVEVRVRGGRAAVIEVAARSIGGLCSRSLELGPGVSLEQVILAHALGRQVAAVPAQSGASGVLMLPIPAAGTLVGVNGRDRALSVDGVTGVEVTIAPGRPVVPVPDGDRYLGFVFARGETPEQVEGALRAAHTELDVRIDPPT